MQQSLKIPGFHFTSIPEKELVAVVIEQEDSKISGTHFFGKDALATLENIRNCICQRACPAYYFVKLGNMHIKFNVTEAIYFYDFCINAIKQII